MASSCTALPWAAPRNHEWVGASTERGALLLVSCMPVARQPSSVSCAVCGLTLTARLQQTVLTLLPEMAEAPGTGLFLWADEAKICITSGNGTRPKSSPKCWSNDRWNSFPPFSLTKLSQRYMFQQILPCVGWDTLVENNYIYLNPDIYRDSLHRLHVSKINTACSQMHTGNLAAGGAGGSPTLGQLTCWHVHPCHRTCLCSELLGRKSGFLNT